MRVKIFPLLLGGAIGAALVLCWASSAREGAPPPLRNSKMSEVERALDRPIATVDFDGVPFDQAIQKLAALGGTPIVLETRRREGNGDENFDFKTPVYLRARNITLAEALDRVIPPNMSAPVIYTPETGVLRVGYFDLLDERPYCRTYPIRDLLPPDAAAAGRVAAIQAFTLYQQQSLLPPANEDAEAITRLICDTVNSDTWRDNGGLIGSIRYVGGQLVVVQTWRSHRQIERLLAELRAPVGQPAPPGAAPEVYLWDKRFKDWVSPDEEVAAAALRHKVSGLTLNSVTLGEAIDELRRRTTASIFVDRIALQAAGISADAKLSVTLGEVTLAEALRVVLASASTIPALGYAADGGVIIISTRDEASKIVLTRAYDLRDWLAGAADATRDGQVDALIKQIEDTVAMDSWREAGGTIGAIREMKGILVVTQTWENQEGVRKLLNAVRSADVRYRPPAPSTAPATLPTGR